MSDIQISGGPEEKGQEQKQNTQDGVGGGGFEGVTLDKLLSFANVDAQFGKDGREYVKTLEKLLKEVDKKFEVVRIPDNNLDVFRVTRDKRSLVLLFTEALTPMADFVPPTHHDILSNVVKLANMASGGKVFDILVVAPEDYERVETMKTHIEHVFTGSTIIRDEIKLSMFDGKFTVDNRLSVVLSEYNKLNPKATRPRIDYGFVLYKNDTSGKNKLASSPTPILVVGGYTRFVHRNNRTGGFGNDRRCVVPIPTITTFMSSLMTDAMVALGIALATEDFIRYRGWLRPFYNFDKNSNAPNLGNFRLVDKKPKPLKNKEELEAFVETYMYKPHLAVSVTDGLPRISGLSSLPGGGDKIKRALSLFLNSNDKQIFDAEITGRVIPSYAGVLSDGQDSRVMDYLTVLSNGVADLSRAIPLLHIHSKPETTLQIISEITDVKSLYVDRMCILNDRYVNRISKTVAKVLHPMFANVMFVDNNVGNLGLEGNDFGDDPIFTSNTSLGESLGDWIFD